MIVRDRVFEILSLTYSEGVKFTSQDVYDLTFPVLSRTNPFNNELKGTVLKELQVLRDLNHMKFHTLGIYSLT